MKPTDKFAIHCYNGRTEALVKKLNSIATSVVGSDTWEYTGSLTQFSIDYGAHFMFFPDTEVGEDFSGLIYIIGYPNFSQR